MRRLIQTCVAAALMALSPALQAQETEASGPEAADYPEPPQVIAEKVVDGRFEPGDYSYLKGAFEGASEQEAAEYAEITAWLDQCGKKGEARLDAEMAALGLNLVEGQFGGAANICAQVVTVDGIRGIETYSDIQEGLPGARLVFNTLVRSVQRAEQRSRPASRDDLGEELHARTLGDQLLRQAFYWGWSEQSDARTPQMNEKERAVFSALLNSELLFVDHQNTQWLKGIVAEHGWPTISKVGERGSGAAWLLTQHADMDPAFQLRALRMIEPLVAEAEVNKRNYAYLYDRIMLKLSGKQRYATQVTCENGQRVARPLEEPERVNELRAQMELETFEEYLGWFDSPC